MGKSWVQKTTAGLAAAGSVAAGSVPASGQDRTIYTMQQISEPTVERQPVNAIDFNMIKGAAVGAAAAVVVTSTAIAGFEIVRSRRRKKEQKLTEEHDDFKKLCTPPGKIRGL